MTSAVVPNVLTCYCHSVEVVNTLLLQQANTTTTKQNVNLLPEFRQVNLKPETTKPTVIENIPKSTSGLSDPYCVLIWQMHSVRTGEAYSFFAAIVNTKASWRAIAKLTLII